MNRYKDIVKIVEVDYCRTPEQALVATGYKLNTSRAVVKFIPVPDYHRGIVKVTVVFFYNDQWLTDDQLEREIIHRRLKNDIIAVAAVNEKDRSFAETHPHGAHFRGNHGHWCSVQFYDNYGHQVDVYRHVNEWPGGGSWYVGTRE